MSQLKKIRMQQIIRQMEDEAQHKAEQDFYGKASDINCLSEYPVLYISNAYQYIMSVENCAPH